MEKFEGPALLVITLGIMIPFALWVAPYIVDHYGLAGAVLFVLHGRRLFHGSKMRTAAIWVFGLLASLVIGLGLWMLWMAPPMSIKSCVQRISGRNGRKTNRRIPVYRRMWVTARPDCCVQ